MFVYASDDVAAGQAALEPFRALSTPLAEAVFPMPYPGIYDFTAEGGKPHPAAIRSLFADALDDEMVDEIVARMSAPSSPFAMTQIRALGGAMARVPADATAFAHRDANVMISLLTVFQDPAEFPIHEAWTKEYFAALSPKSTGVYSNFLAREGDARIREAYPAGSYERLAEIKRRYDPQNLFRMNQNIRPAGAGFGAA
jgi:FAD/FMN-containing dehydrogenase